MKNFVDGRGLMNGVALLSAGFFGMPDGTAMEEVQNDAAGPMGGNPCMESTLSVWESVADLEHFVWNTVHKRFFARQAEWYDMSTALRFVMWWVPEGLRPDMVEAMARFRHLEEQGPSDHAFGWDWV